MDTGYSLSDIASIVGKNDGLLGGNGTGFIILILFLLMMGGGFWGNNATAQTITNDFLYTNLSNQLGRTGDRIENTMNTGFTAVAQQGFNIDKDILNQTNQINQSIANLGYTMQNCCCGIERNIDSVKYEAIQNTSAIMQNDTTNTQKILDKLCSMEMNAKDAKIADLTNQLQSAQLTLGNANQTQNILNALGSYQPYSNGCGCNCY